MKKTSTAESRNKASEDLRPEYQLDYRKARPNRFASRVDKSRLVVVLDPDIAQVFTSPEAVNKVLRALISTMPTTPKKKLHP